jgi:hypothetical protein
MRRTLVFALSFGILFSILATWLGPKAITYYFTPPEAAGVNPMLQCTSVLDYGMRRLVQIQLIGTAVGLLAGAILALASRTKRTSAAEALPPPRAPAPAEPPARK